MDLEKINEIECEKILVEFLRCNAFIRKTFDIDYSDYTLRRGNYWHLPLEKKVKLLEKIKKAQLSVCDDVPEHYEYFKRHINYNSEDCCNLRINRGHISMDILELKIEELVPYENNPRINDQAVDKVAASIREFGFKVPIVIDKDNVIVAGHTRLEAAKLLGLESVPCIKADDLTDDQVREFRIIDNKTQELADWDLDIMRAELESITGIDMSEFGFMIEEIEDQKKKDAEKKEKEDAKKAVKEICCPRCGRVVGVK